MDKKDVKLIPDRLPPACSESDRYDAFNLIQTGLRSEDKLTVQIGQARLRVLENRATAEDLELLGIKSNK
jgi:hypothetical protein